MRVAFAAVAAVAVSVFLSSAPARAAEDWVQTACQGAGAARTCTFCVKSNPKKCQTVAWPEPPNYTEQNNAASKEAAAKNLQQLLHDSNVDIANNVMSQLAAQGAKNMGANKYGAADLGRLVSRMTGVGKWTAHFYNQTDFYWAVAMVRSGSCHLFNTPGDEGQGSHFACFIPPHGTGVLDFNNPGGGEVARIAVVSGQIAGLAYEHTYDLPVVGCHIQYDAPQQYVHLNSPSTCDITAHDCPWNNPNCL